MIIVSDTSPIANLIQIGELEILNLMFGKVIIPPSVHREIEALRQFNVDLTEFETADWIEKVAPLNVLLLQNIKLELDEGESEAIVVASELGAHYLLIDERLGTAKARQFGLETVGLIGVLIKAKREGIIREVKPILDSLIKDAGFWIGQKLYLNVLKTVSEA